MKNNILYIIIITILLTPILTMAHHRNESENNDYIEYKCDKIDYKIKGSITLVGNLVKEFAKPTIFEQCVDHNEKLIFYRTISKHKNNISIIVIYPIYNILRLIIYK